MNVYALRIADAATEAALAAARWQLFVFPQVRDLRRGISADVVEVLYEGGEPNVGAWLAVLEQAGYEAEPLGPGKPEAGAPLEAA